MSQAFQIPVQLEFRPMKTYWRLMEAQIVGWCSEFRTKKSGALFASVPPLISDWLVISISPDYWNGPLSRLLGLEPCETPTLLQMQAHQLPKSLAAMCGEPGPDAAISDEAKDELFPVLVGETSGDRMKKAVDVKLMRDEFFGLNGGLEELLRFARRWGLWDFNMLWRYQGPDTIRSIGESGVPCLFPHQIVEAQTELSKALHGTPEAWLSTQQAAIPTVQRQRRPYFFAEPGDCRTAIQYTITLEHLSGAKFGICEQPDCRIPFPFKSGHQRKYCSPECAHLMAVRASRKRAKQKNKPRKTRG